MSSNTISLSRDQLSKIVGNNPQALRAFEQVFSAAGVSADDIALFKSQAGAAAIGNKPSGTIAAITVQAALNELDMEKVAESDLAAVGGAALVGNKPAGNVSALTVQAAINELDSEKASAVQVQSFSFNVSAITGTANALAVSFSPVITSLSPGALLIGKAVATNTSSTPTLSVNAISPKQIVKINSVALLPGDIVAGAWLLFTYDIGNNNFVLLNPAQVSPSAVVATRNLVTNGGFQINQRGVVGTITLSAGQYGYDRWKAGANGCTFTVAPSGVDNAITITAGSLIHIIDGPEVEGGAYVLSQAGTAKARIAGNGSVPSGSYSALPLQLASATATQTITVEFTLGTVLRVQLEPGSSASAFIRRSFSTEVATCQRYFRYLNSSAGVAGNSTMAAMYSSWGDMNAAPTIASLGPVTVDDTTATYTQSSATVTTVNSTNTGGIFNLSNFTGLTPFRPLGIRSGRLTLSCDL